MDQWIFQIRADLGGEHWVPCLPLCRLLTTLAGEGPGKCSLSAATEHSTRFWTTSAHHPQQVQPCRVKARLPWVRRALPPGAAAGLEPGMGPRHSPLDSSRVSPSVWLWERDHGAGHTVPQLSNYGKCLFTFRNIPEHYRVARRYG